MATRKGYARLSLATLEGTRKTLARLTRELYNRELRDMEPQEIRLCIDAAKAVLSAHKIEADMQVAARLDVLEARLDKAGR